MPRTSWPDGFVVRAPRPDEDRLVSDLICTCDTADTGEPDWSIEETRGDWIRLGFNLARDARIVIAPDSRLVAYTDVFARPNAVEVAANTCLSPEFRSKELDEALISLAESLAAQHAPLAVRWMVSSQRAPVIEARGYEPFRWVWRMRGDLTEPPSPAEWPASFGIRTMEPQDERRVYELIEEAFVRPDRAPVSYEAWRRFIIEREDFDRSLAFVVVFGGEIVGTAMCLMFPEAKEGWVRQLAVDARFRGRGLGKALLLHAFGIFYRRGAKRSGLGVDANNPSAIQLYVGLGMRSLQEYVQFERPASP